MTLFDADPAVEPAVEPGPYDACWPQIAVLDHLGTIVSTNASWDLFRRLNGGGASVVGTNYVDLCERSGALTVAHGLRCVLSAESAHFDLTYSCPSPIEDRWFLFEAASSGTGVLITHTNITALMLTNDTGELAADDDPLTRLPTLARGLEMIQAALAESSTSGIRAMVATISITALADLALSHGRLARDSVIIQTLARTRRLMRTGDFVVRTGPAVLMLVARDVDDRGSDQLLEELTQVLVGGYQVGPFELHPETTVQIVTSDTVTTAAGLLQQRPDQVRARSSLAAIAAAGDEGGDDLDSAIVGSPLPMMVFSLPDQRVRAANRAAADLLGLTAAQLTRRYAKDLFRPTDRGKTTVDLSALAAGALDSYRARRTLIGADGPVLASIWVRAIPRRSGAMALLLVLPADHDDQFQLPTRALMGPLAVDLASGTMDDSGAIATLSRSNPGVLHSQRDGESQTRELIAHVHPKDQARLRDGLRRFRIDRHNLVIALRIRHAHRGWIPTDCHLFPTGDDNSGEPIGFVLAEAAAVVPVSGRVAQLEQHLTRIAAETAAADVAMSTAPGSERPTKDLSALTARQREIVVRLLDGQRVPTIAAALYLSRTTVRNHLTRVYRTFDVHTQSGLLEALRAA